ncbi:hypothetical protein [Klebsiella quasipneumoniae]|uniref:hypothetical protein n=1 Tax=Klebsiella quasipneumoniae TaxID=1463165 RepID=UPI001D12DF51|nr:hypothetical protein [Klebsiella quasipneumoniae]
MTNITVLAQSLKRRAASANEFGEGLFFIKADDVLALVEALEKAQGMEAYWKTQCRGITDHCEELQARIAELEREQEHLRPVGVMSEKAFHRLENSECRFIALWPRPGIFLPRKRPEDGVIVYARTAAAAGIKVEAE